MYKIMKWLFIWPLMIMYYCVLIFAVIVKYVVSNFSIFSI